MDEFVALSEERVRELATSSLDAVGRDQRHLQSVVKACRRELRRAASEASENTKRWLMEKVCRECGSSNHEDGEAAGEVWHDFRRFGGEPASASIPSITRAEYLSRTEGR